MSDKEKMLAELCPGGVIRLGCTGSTNDAAFEAAEQGAGDWTLVTAEKQTGGRGRMQRRWVMTPGSSIAMSLLLRLTPEEEARLPLFAALAGLSVCEALRTYGIEAQVKWPNDVLIGGKKCCGVLCETRWIGDELLGPVIGIGVNVLHGSVPDLPEMNYPAVSIEDAAGLKPDLTELTAAIIRELRRLRPLLGSDAFFDLWQGRLAYLHQQVTLCCQEREPVRCVLKGVDRAGSLVVVYPDGREDHILAGEVSVRLN